MAEETYKQKKNERELDSTLHKRKKDHGTPRADLPRRQLRKGLTTFSQFFSQMGNTALNRLLGRHNSGQPLEAKLRGEMEQTFGTDFSEVQVHSDNESEAAAEALHAKAFTHEKDIYLGGEAPAPEMPAGKKLFAHELAHVVQQKRASATQTNRVSRAGDAFEQKAHKAAMQAIQGRQVEIATSGSPPAVQRDERDDRFATRVEVGVALREFLERALRAQGGQNLRLTPEVRRAVEMLASDDLNSSLQIQAWLASPALPARPEEFAREVAQRLPESFDREKLERLEQMAVQETPGVVGRVRRLVQSSAPGGGQQRIEPPPQPSSEGFLEQLEQDARRERGIKERRIGPVSVDVLRARRIIRGLPEALRGRRQQPETPEIRQFPQVENAIQEQIRTDALVPSGEESGSFADAQEVARGLMRLLDEARRSGRDTVDLRLGANYNRIRNRQAIFSELERIALIVRNRLPHRAEGVRRINVYFGDRLVRFINLELAAERRRREGQEQSSTQ